MLPEQVQMKLLVKANWMILLAEAAQKGWSCNVARFCQATPHRHHNAWAMRDSSLRLLHRLEGSHELIRPCKANNLSAGRRAAWLIKSSLIPNTTSTVVGPSHFPRWRGRPSRLQTAGVVLMLCTQWGEGAAVISHSERSEECLTKEN